MLESVCPFSVLGEGAELEKGESTQKEEILRSHGETVNPDLGTRHGGWDDHADRQEAPVSESGHSRPSHPGGGSQRVAQRESVHLPAAGEGSGP